VWERAFDALSDAVWLLDSEQRITRCNRASCEMFGQEADQLLGRHCWEVVHKTDGPVPECPAVRMRTTRRRESMELCTDGRMFHVTADPFFTDGKMEGCVHIIRDMTAQGQARAELRRLNEELERRVEERTAEVARSEQKYRSLVESTVDVPCNVGADGVIRYVGPQVRTYGFAPDGLVGKQIFEVVLPDDREHVAADFKRALATGETFPTEFRVLAPDGTVYWFEEQSTMQRDEDGGITGLVGVLRNITKRKRAEQELQERERFLTRVMNSSLNGIYIYDDHRGINTFINTRYTQLTGYTLADLNAMSREQFFELFHPDDREQIMEHIREVDASSDDDVLPIEYRFKTKDGNWIWCLAWDAVFAREDDGRVCQQIGTFLNITERKKTEELSAEQRDRLHKLAAKLASAQDEEQRRVAEGLHDDVAQLLTACSLNTGVAAKTDDAEERREALEDVLSLLQRTNEKVRLLSFELASSTLYRLGLREALEELCQSMSERYNVCFEVGGEPLTEELDEATATVLFKSARELLFNVVKHAGVSAATVSLHSDGGMLQLAVEDRGTGFPQTVEAEELDPGRGLGLFGIRERLADLGGRMRIESEAGVSTRVTLWAPITVLQ